MNIGLLCEKLQTFGNDPAIAATGEVTTYRELCERIAANRQFLHESGVARGTVVSVEGDYHAQSIAALLSVALHGCIAVPLSQDSLPRISRLREIAHVQWRLQTTVQATDLIPTGVPASAPLYEVLRGRGHPGLVLFTSGSTGESKAAVHDFDALLAKFLVPRRRLRTLVFLQLDHVGGLNTLLYTLSNGGLAVSPPERSPVAICRCIEQYQIELLPTSPTFLNLLLLSGAYRNFDLSSLSVITYGTEPMPQSTLDRLHQAFPHVELKQTYGLTELGILRSQSRERNSLWVRLGGEGFETKVVDGRLWVKAHSTMLGYLNAPASIDEEGFLDTGDRVEVDGDWFRILGRESDIINVGGHKVYPSEVETALLELDNVTDAVVFGQPHPLSGQTVTAKVVLAAEESPREFRMRMREFLAGCLPPFAIPSQVQLTAEPLHTERFKRLRR